MRRIMAPRLWSQGIFGPAARGGQSRNRGGAEIEASHLSPPVGTLATCPGTARLAVTREEDPMAEHDVEITGKVRDKLIERKQDWAREGRLLTGTTADPARDR